MIDFRLDATTVWFHMKIELFALSDDIFSRPYQLFSWCYIQRSSTFPHFLKIFNRFSNNCFQEKFSRDKLLDKFFMWKRKKFNLSAMRIGTMAPFPEFFSRYSPLNIWQPWVPFEWEISPLSSHAFVLVIYFSISTCIPSYFYQAWFNRWARWVCQIVLVTILVNNDLKKTRKISFILLQTWIKEAFFIVHGMVHQ